jgi:hypothetical protein
MSADGEVEDISVDAWMQNLEQVVDPAAPER